MENPMSVTIREIAQQAGVSRGTVDRVLNGRSGVKPEIRERILAIADELQYVPNVAAKALAYNRKPIQIGIVMPPKEISFFDDIRKGIHAAEDELKGLGICLEYVYINNQLPDEGARAIQTLIANGASGILFSAIDDEVNRASIDKAIEQGIPVVTFNSDVENSKRSCFVGQDLGKSGEIAAGLMTRMFTGKAKVLVVVANMKFHAHRMRVQYFKEKLIQSEIEIVDVIEGYDRYEDTFRKLNESLQRYPDLDGIYMATGDAGACIDAVKLAGKGGQLRIVCNDLMPEVEQGLREGVIDFTIMQNPIQQGYRSLRILYDLIFTGKKPDHEFQYTDTSIMIAESL
ncbi:substrate-binding domain-containing protein [Paenibacillus sp. LMG 31461]|uniref:Substrate-binding domain-containing protein n=2 Tax=Paenibacillus plantarum TaxID=2654975 RepID=A0ABX1X8Y1_9BACL|nr:substrate-binding domain-containing protein [Paenibacillus plantarum]